MVLKNGEAVYITAGFYKGRRLMTPGEGTHPMGARERIALFNMIGNNLRDFEVLDAFAGSGALGLEAISRGAAYAVFIEKNRAAAEVIKTNIKTLGVDGVVKVCSASKYEDEQVYNLVFADPPYDKFDLEEVLHLVKFVSENGIFVLSHPGEAPELPGLRLWKSNQYAGATISIYQR
ncbi:16S rRNA (guanine(966)-N(2))-methyltransferase RsmD [Candidatus Saccharibacteria bacterium]|nr:16S rRNA (guanine(966)-N(2))-methyltransferase RsmD [Candidatus Saccharibacteria bacterium]